MTSRSRAYLLSLFRCRLIIILTIFVRLTLTLAKVCPYFRLITTNTTRKEFPIEMYMEGPPHESYFITLTLQGEIIIKSTKKLVTFYIVEDLILVN